MVNIKSGMHYDERIIQKKDGFWHILPSEILRKTDKVDFDSVPVHEKTLNIERVAHQPGALSPGKIGEVECPWYMHPHQEDNLMTIVGVRKVELFNPNTKEYGLFEVSADWIKLDNKIIFEGFGVLGWCTGIFHRNSSSEGSVSMNLGVRFDGFNIDTEFNIYDIDMETRKVKFLQKGSIGQKF